MAESSRSLPPYRRIAAKIRARIERGEIQPGERIPSVREIIRDEGVSTATATRVAAVLRADGFAESVPGIGTLARLPRPAATGPDRLSAFRTTGSGFLLGERVEILDAALTPAPEEVASALELDKGAFAIRRRRRYVDGQGVITVSTSWLPGDLADSAPELLAAEPLPTMTFGLVEERTGRRAVRRRDMVKLRLVPEDLAELLGAEPGAVALTMANHYWDQDGAPTEYAIDFLGAGRELFGEYELE